jgi:hypothetical protein
MNRVFPAKADAISMTAHAPHGNRVRAAVLHTTPEPAFERIDAIRTFFVIPLLRVRGTVLI